MTTAGGVPKGPKPAGTVRDSRPIKPVKPGKPGIKPPKGGFELTTPSRPVGTVGTYNSGATKKGMAKGGTAKKGMSKGGMTKGKK
jgi:hypothetical protein